MTKCATTQGPHRCRKNAGHVGECENDPGLGKQGRVIIQTTEDLDAQRELAKAAKRIVALEAALTEIATMSCDAIGGAAPCACCCFDRMVAQAALAGVT